MKTPSIRISVIAAACALLVQVPALYAQAPAPAATPVYGKAAENKNFAQQLVNQLMADNPDLYSAGIHAVPPGAKDMVIVAQTKDLIGKKSSASDLKIFHEDQI